MSFSLGFLGRYRLKNNLKPCKAWGRIRGGTRCRGIRNGRWLEGYRKAPRPSLFGSDRTAFFSKRCTCLMVLVPSKLILFDGNEQNNFISASFQSHCLILTIFTITMLAFEQKRRKTKLPQRCVIRGISMKNLRTTVVLQMAFSLMEGKGFSEASIRDELNVSRSTFYRSLSDLRCFFMELRPFQEIEYDEGKKVYFLGKDKE